MTRVQTTESLILPKNVFFLAQMKFSEWMCTYLHNVIQGAPAKWYTWSFWFIFIGSDKRYIVINLEVIKELIGLVPQRPRDVTSRQQRAVQVYGTIRRLVRAHFLSLSRVFCCPYVVDARIKLFDSGNILYSMVSNVNLNNYGIMCTWYALWSFSVETV